MNIQSYLKGFSAYLKLERSLSENSINAYLNDVSKLFEYLQLAKEGATLKTISLKELREFIIWLNELGAQASTQARVISGIKSFFMYLMEEELIDNDPSALLETPKISRKLPDTLSIHEIDQLITAIDVSKPE